MSKTQSRVGVTIPAVTNVPNVQLMNLNQLIVANAGYVKLDFATFGTVISNNSNGLLVTDLVNDGFTSAVKASKWLVSYSGYLSSNLSDTNNVTLSAYVNNLSVVSSVTVLNFAANIGTVKPFSKTFIVDIPVGQNIDLRIASTDTDANIRTTLTLTQLS